jgi:hypothetical protein
VEVLQVYAGEQASASITALLATLPATVAVIVNLVRVEGVGQDVQEVRQNTRDLANGLMDAKVRAGVAEVLDPALIDEAAVEQLERDRARVAAAHDDDQGPVQ